MVCCSKQHQQEQQQSRKTNLLVNQQTPHKIERYAVLLLLNTVVLTTQHSTQARSGHLKSIWQSPIQDRCISGPIECERNKPNVRMLTNQQVFESSQQLVSAAHIEAFTEGCDCTLFVDGEFVCDFLSSVKERVGGLELMGDLDFRNAIDHSGVDNDGSEREELYLSEEEERETTKGRDQGWGEDDEKDDRGGELHGREMMRRFTDRCSLWKIEPDEKVRTSPPLSSEKE